MYRLADVLLLLAWGGMFSYMLYNFRKSPLLTLLTGVIFVMQAVITLYGFGVLT